LREFFPRKKEVRTKEISHRKKGGGNICGEKKRVKSEGKLKEKKVTKNHYCKCRKKKGLR